MWFVRDMRYTVCSHVPHFTHSDKCVKIQQKSKSPFGKSINNKNQLQNLNCVTNAVVFCNSTSIFKQQYGVLLYLNNSKICMMSLLYL